MIVILYKWKIKPGKEEEFQRSWSFATQMIRTHCGSYGSRLHKAQTGEWLGYAQWPSVEARSTCRIQDESFLKSRDAMNECIESTFEELHLDIMADYLVHQP